MDYFYGAFDLDKHRHYELSNKSCLKILLFLENRFGTTLGWVNTDRIVIFGWTTNLLSFL